MNINLSYLAAALDIENADAFRTGFHDGRHQGFDLSMGMTYDDPYSQWAYDVGTHLGACAAVHPDRKEQP